MLGEESALPIQKDMGLLQYMKHADQGNDQIEREIDTHQNDSNIDRFFKTLEKDSSQDGKQDKSDAHLALQPMRGERIVNKMGRRVRRGESHGDDEVGGGESEQNEHNYLAGPSRK